MVKITTENTPTNSQQPNQTNPQTETKSQSNLLTIIGQFLPFAPLVFEQMTGQKVPQLSGTVAEMSQTLTTLQLSLQQVLTNQQALNQRLIALETQATQSFTNLAQQVQTIQSLRLTHEKERKQIEYNPSPKLEPENNY